MFGWGKKGKSVKSQTDDFDIDWENLDLPMDYQSEPLKTKRDVSDSPIRQFVSGFTKEIKNTDIEKTIKDTLPENYGSVFDLKDDIQKNVTDVMAEASREYRRNEKTIKRTLKLALDKGMDYDLPPSLKKKLDKARNSKWLENDKLADYALKNGESIEEAQLNRTLHDVFNAQMIQAEVYRKRDEKRSEFKETVEHGRFQANQQQLNEIRMNTARMVRYQDSINIQYQRKSLELQLRQHRISLMQLDALRSLDVNIKNELQGIRKNTALSDYVKMTHLEAGKQQWRNRFYNQLGEGLFGKGTPIGRLVSNMRGKAIEKIQAIGGQLGMSADMLEMMAQGLDGQGGSSWESLGRLGAIGARNLATSQARKYIERHHPGVTGLANQAELQIINAEATIRQWAQRNKSNLDDFKDERGKWNMDAILESVTGLQRSQLKDKAARERFEIIAKALKGAGKRILDSIAKPMLANLINSSTGLETSLGRASLGEMRKPAIITQHFTRSVTEIIPGYLARILREVTALRTGDDKTELVSFDLSKGKFTTQSKLAQSFKNEFVSKKTLESKQSKIDSIMDEIDKDGQLTKAQRDAIGNILAKDSVERNKIIDKSYLTDKGNFSSLDRRTQDTYMRLMKTYLSDDKDHSRTLGLSKKIHSFKDPVMNPAYMSQELIDYGYGDMLEQMGIIQEDESGGYKTNTTRLLEWYLGDEDSGFSGSPLASGRDFGGGPGGGGNGRGPRTGPTGPSRRRRRLTSDLPPDSLRNRTGGAPSGPNDDLNLGGAVAPTLAESMTEAFSNIYSSDFISRIGLADKLDALAQAQVEARSLMLDNLGERITGIETALMNLTLAEAGPNVGDIGSGGPSGERRRGIIGRTLGALGSGVTWFGKWYGNYLKNVYKGTKAVFKAPFSLMGSLLGGSRRDGLTISDIYLDGEVVMSARRLRKGEYRDQESGNVILTLEDIKGAVVDKEGNVVLEAEDISRAQVKDKSGKLGLLGKVVRLPMKVASGVMGFMGSYYTNMFKLYGTAFKLGIKGTKKVLDIGGAQDVYLAGEDTPVLLARLMRKGAYLSKESGKVIRTVNDIDGTVVDRDGNVILSTEDISGGLYNKHGQELGGTLKRLFNFGTRTVKKAWGVYQNITKRLVKTQLRAIKGAFTGGASIIGSLFGRGGKVDNTEVLLANATLQEQTNNTLGSIYQLLDERMPGKKVFGDTDDDGDTEGSVKDLIQRRLAERNKKKEEKGEAKEGEGKEKEKKESWIDKIFGGLMDKLSGGLMAALGAIGTSVFGGIKKLGKAAWSKITGKAGSAADDAAKAAKGGWFKRGWGKVAKLFGKIKGGGKMAALAAGLSAMYLFFTGGSKAEAADVADFSKDGSKAQRATQQQQGLAYGMGVGSAPGLQGTEPQEDALAYADNADMDRYTKDADFREERDSEVDSAGSMGSMIGLGAAGGISAAKWGMNTIRTLKGGPVAAQAASTGVSTAAARSGGFLGGIKDGFKGVWGQGLKGGLGKGAAALLSKAKWRDPFNLMDIARGGMKAYTSYQQGNNRGIAGGVGNAAGGIAGSIIGQALIPIPVVGGVIGGLVGSWVGEKLGGAIYDAGRSFTRRGQTELDKIRLMQYGISPDNSKVWRKVFDLEDMLAKFVIIQGGQAVLKSGFSEERMLQLLDADADNQESMQRMNQWFNRRFKPIFLLSLKTQQSITGKMNIAGMDDMNTEQAIQYLGEIKLQSKDYPQVPTPFSDLDMTEVNDSEVTTAIEGLQAQYKQEGKKKDTSTSDIGGTVRDFMDKAKFFSPLAMAGHSFLKAKDWLFGGNKDSKDKKKEIAVTVAKDNSLFGKGMSLLKSTLEGDNFIGKMLSFTPQGMMMKGMFKASKLFGFFKGGNVDALTAIRMKAYGLKDLKESEIKTYLKVEEVMLNEGIVSPNGDVSNEQLRKNFKKIVDAFGISSKEEPMLGQYLMNRFLPVFTAFVKEAKNQTGSNDFYGALSSLHPSKKLVIADGIRGARSQMGSVFAFPWAPLVGNQANTDASSTDGNWQMIKADSKGAAMGEEVKANAESRAKTEGKEANNIFTRMLDNIKEGAKNLWDRAKDVYQAAKDGAGGIVDSVVDNAKAVIGGEKSLGDAASDVGGAVKDAFVNTANAVTGKPQDNALMLYRAFKKAGFSHNQARVLVAEVGRENGLQDKYLFGTHTDAANGAMNIGMISWQGGRARALAQYLAKKGVMSGGKMQQSEAAIQAQAEFLMQEMRTKSFGASKANAQAIDEFLGNPNIEVNRGMDLVGQHFIKWAINNPKYRAGGIRNRNTFLKTVDAALEKNGEGKEVATTNTAISGMGMMANAMGAKSSVGGGSSSSSGFKPGISATAARGTGGFSNIGSRVGSSAVINSALSGTVDRAYGDSFAASGLPKGNSATPWMDIARAQLGKNEKTDDPWIRECHATCNLNTGGKTPWCASFVNWVLLKAGIKGTRSAAAISFKDWGVPAPSGAYPYGAILVIRFSKGNHVAFCAGEAGGSVKMLGGNQSSKKTGDQRNGGEVTVSSVSKSNIIAVRLPPGYNGRGVGDVIDRSATKAPTEQKGAVGRRARLQAAKVATGGMTGAQAGRGLGILTTNVPSVPASSGRDSGSGGGSAYNNSVTASIGANGKTQDMNLKGQIAGAISAATAKIPSGHRILKAVSAIRKNAKAKSSGYCARFTINALQAAGYRISRGNAYEFYDGAKMKAAGFVQIPNNAPNLPGDVKVWNRVPSAGANWGHICMWDGSNWVSDFVQRSPYVRVVYRTSEHSTWRDGTLMGIKPDAVGKDSGRDAGARANAADAADQANMDNTRAQMSAREQGGLSQAGSNLGGAQASPDALAAQRASVARGNVPGVITGTNSNGQSGGLTPVNGTGMPGTPGFNPNNGQQTPGVFGTVGGVVDKFFGLTGSPLGSAGAKIDAMRSQAQAQQRLDQQVNEVSSILKESLGVQKEQLSTLKEIKSALGSVNANTGKGSGHSQADDLVQASQQASKETERERMNKKMEGITKSTYQTNNPLNVGRTPMKAA